MNSRMLLSMIFIVLLTAGAAYSQDELRGSDNTIEKLQWMVFQDESEESEPAEGTLARTDDDHERGHYDRALGYYFAEHPEKARNEFKKFIDNYPHSRLIPNACYWLAETYYMVDEFPQAILIFRRVLEKFPDHPKAPDSLLKIGYSYARLNDMPNSLFYLGILLEDYPGSSAADKALVKVMELESKG